MFPLQVTLLHAEQGDPRVLRRELFDQRSEHVADRRGAAERLEGGEQFVEQRKRPRGGDGAGRRIAQP
jgi:hypothetical protein